MIGQLGRRSILAAGAGFLAAAASPRLGQIAFGPIGFPSWSANSLQAAAAAKGLTYGTAVPITRFRQDPNWRLVASRDCGVLVCDNVMKLDIVSPQPDILDFSGADQTVRFARGNGQRMRGTTLVWHEALPSWARTRLAQGSARAEALMRQWINAVAQRYAGGIESWDVVNEIVAYDAARPDGLRYTPWLQALGPSYVDLAFHMLKDADPASAALWNENDCEQDAPWIEARRGRILRLLEGLQRRGVPIERLGLQGHLASSLPIDQTRLRSFLHEIAQMGLAIEITELDVDDRAFPSDIATRDQGVADLTRRFLDAALDEPAVLSVLTWDFYDPDTWLNGSPDRRRPDGFPQRALPFDENYRRKPMWQAMLKAFSDAPDYGVIRAHLRTMRKA